jgi:alpha-glucosidase (family GH31 glycosyl hydrolase)
VLETRYRMLPYLYTLLYRATKFGDSVTRSPFMNFPGDQKTWDIDEQMMWGDGLLITPVLKKDQNSVTGYLPEANRWFDYYTGDELETGTHIFSAGWDQINLHLKGGRIIPAMAQTS